VLVGGAKPGQEETLEGAGLMTNPDTAALDPIFWLHHANIDRLWEVWRGRPGQHKNPTQTAWLGGPASRKFTVPDVNGNARTFAARDVLDTHAPNLDYDYEDVSDPLGGAIRAVARLEALGAAAPRAAAAAGDMAMERQRGAELVGASDSGLSLSGSSIETQVRLDRGATRALAGSFQPQAMAAAPKEPDRVFLNLENIRGGNDGAVFDVYVGLPPGADPAAHPDRLAGVVSLFGVRKASRTDGAHAGNGINEVLDITPIVDALHLENALDAAEHLNVRFVPRRPIKPEHDISVGRISVYRESQ
jgi:tyrosinase